MKFQNSVASVAPEKKYKIKMKKIHTLVLNLTIIFYFSRLMK
jgi:hypothetical protein